MYIPNSDPNSVDDIDLMGVFTAPKAHYIGLDQQKQTIDRMIKLENVILDCVFYELRHFVKLLLKGNPNVLSMLWLKPEHYIYINDTIRELIVERRIFASRQSFHSFAGYAASQLNRMERYSLNGYMGEKRKALVDKYGYDCKNAAHLIRLLSMCIEFMHTGKLRVFRNEDREMPLDIKTGKWALEDVKYAGEYLFRFARMAYNNSKLRDYPDYERIKEIVTKIVSQMICG
jgi:predicted nucleotidyltransferase